MTGTTIFLLMPRSWNSSKAEFILFEEQPRIWGQLFTAIPRTVLEIWKEKKLTTLNNKKKARQEKQINMNLRNIILFHLPFFGWKITAFDCSSLSHSLKESMDTSITSYQYSLVQCQPIKFRNGITSMIVLLSSVPI